MKLYMIITNLVFEGKDYGGKWSVTSTISCRSETDCYNRKARDEIAEYLVIRAVPRDSDKVGGGVRSGPRLTVAANSGYANLHVDTQGSGLLVKYLENGHATGNDCFSALVLTIGFGGTSSHPPTRGLYICREAH